MFAYTDTHTVLYADPDAHTDPLAVAKPSHVTFPIALPDSNRLAKPDSDNYSNDIRCGFQRGIDQRSGQAAL